MLLVINNKFARENGYMEILPVCCEIDHKIINANHGILYCDYTLANDDKVSDYWFVTDQINNPE